MACALICLTASNIWTKYASLNIEEEFAVNLAIVMRWKFDLPLFSNSHFLLASASVVSTLKGVKRGNRIGDKTTIRGQSWMTELDE